MKKFVVFFSFFVLISLSLLPSILIVNNIEATPTTPPLSIVSTRGDFWVFSGDLITGVSPTSYHPSIAEVAPNCTPDREIVIYVHGWNADEQDALDQFNKGIIRFSWLWTANYWFKLGL